MNTPDLEKRFEDAFDRLRGAKPAISSIYNEGPLASDHFLLNKSWAYFKARVRVIEDQWREILSTKDFLIQNQQREIESLKTRVQELEALHKNITDFEHLSMSLRAKDFSEFKKNENKLKHAWEEERYVLESQNRTLEGKLSKAKGELDEKVKQFEKKEKRLTLLVQELEIKLKEANEKHLQEQRKVGDSVKGKDDQIKAESLKNDLLKGEIERRDAVIKEHEKQIKDLHSQLNNEVDQSEELKDALLRQSREMELLKKKNELLSQEKEMIRSSWSREQAEWRELWEKSRDVWEKQQASVKLIEDKLRKI